MSDAGTYKREAAARALDFVRPGMVLGLGTGSTVAHFLELLGRALADGRLSDVVGVPSSERTVREAQAAGIPLVGLGEAGRLDLTVDGADEVTPGLDLVKGMGGALLREKMVAQASDRMVVIADESKAVPRLGTRSPLPVEVIPWGWEAHVRFMEDRGATVTRRTREDGTVFQSDNGHPVLDCAFPGGIADPAALDEALNRRAGVVDHGLFLGVADVAILAGPGGVRAVGDPW